MPSASGVAREGLHHLALGSVDSHGQRARGAEPDAGHLRAHLLPAPAGPQGRIELPAGAPAAHPDQPEVPHRCAPGRRVGLEVVHREPGPDELERVPGPEDAAADHDGPGVRAPHAPAGVTCGRGSLRRRAPTAGWRRPPPRVVRARRSRCPATKTLAPAVAATGAVVGVDPAVHLDVERQASGVDLRPHLLDLGHDVGDEALATEPREHRHAQHEVDVGQIGPHGLEGCVRIQRQTRPAGRAGASARSAHRCRPPRRARCSRRRRHRRSP